MTRFFEASQLLDVQMDELAGPFALIADYRRTRRQGAQPAQAQAAATMPLEPAAGPGGGPGARHQDGRPRAGHQGQDQRHGHRRRLQVRSREWQVRAQGQGRGDGRRAHGRGGHLADAQEPVAQERQEALHERPQHGLELARVHGLAEHLEHVAGRAHDRGARVVEELEDHGHDLKRGMAAPQRGGGGGGIDGRTPADAHAAATRLREQEDARYEAAKRAKEGPGGAPIEEPPAPIMATVFLEEFKNRTIKSRVRNV